MLKRTTTCYTTRRASVVAGPIHSNIVCDNILNDKYAESEGINTFNFGLAYCFYLTRNLGINFGAEYNQYKNTASYKGAYRAETSTVDRFNYIYYPTVNSDYTDTRKLDAIDIPINLRFSSAFGEKFEWFMDLGIRLNAVITNKLTQEGVHKKMGSYPSANYDNVFIVIENDPYYGYNTTTYSGSPKAIDSKELGYSIMACTGFKAKFSKNLGLMLSAYYVKGQSDMGPKSQEDYKNIFVKNRPIPSLHYSKLVSERALCFTSIEYYSFSISFFTSWICSWMCSVIPPVLSRISF